MKTDRRRAADIFGFTVVILLFLVVLAQEDTFSIYPDTQGYIEFARGIQSGSIFDKYELGTVPVAYLIRTPGFPLVIALSKWLILSEIQGVVVFHILLTVLVASFMAIQLRSFLPMTLSALILFLTLAPVYFVIFLVLTEWMTINLLILFFVTLVSVLKRPNNLLLYLQSSIATFIVLTRPALVSLLFVGLIPFVRKENRSSTRIGVFILGFAPLLLWMSFNLYRLDRFVLAPFSGYQLFGSATLIGHAQVDERDDSDLTHFITEVNVRKQPRAGKELEFMDSLASNYELSLFDYNIWKVGDVIRKEKGWSVVKTNKLMLLYSVRAISNNIDSMFRYIAHGFERFWIYFSLSVCLMAGPLTHLSKRKEPTLALAALSMFLLHWLHSFMVAAMPALLYRYHLVTFYPFCFACAIFYAVVLRNYCCLRLRK